MNVHGLLIDAAGRAPAAPALTHGPGTWTFAELREGAARTAAMLRAEGVGRGDRVALLAENGLRYVTGFFGILEAGACCVALNHTNKPPTHRALLRDSGAVGLIAEARQARALPEFAAGCPDLRFAALDRIDPRWDVPGGLRLLKRDEAEEAAAVAAEAAADAVSDIGPDDLAAILYTSGSTGRPRGVTLTHGNLLANTRQILGYLPLTAADSVLVVLPFYYSFGNSLLLTHIACGGRLVVDNRFAYPQKVLETLAAERCTGFSGVPSHYAILAARTDFLQTGHPHLRYLTQAGGAMSPALTARIRDALPERIDIYVMYGQTEASARLSWLPPDRLREKLGSIGIGIPEVSLKVQRPDGAECDVDEVGEIVASGPNIMRGYWNDPDETAKVLHADGLHTGDLARRDADGFIFIVDRVKNMIKSGAHRVSSKEVEETILELEGVVEACVVGVSDELLGEAIEAWLVRPGDDPDRTRILRHCAAKLAAFKLPRELHFVDALPKNSFGKVLKDELRRGAR